MTDAPTDRKGMPTWAEVTLMVVAALAGVLFVLAMFVPNMLYRTGQAHVAKAKANLATFRSAVDEFQLDCHRYPTTKEGFGALYRAPAGLKSWHGPYLQKQVPLDPWGNPYVYKAPGPNGKDGYLVESYGADSRPGGDGEDADIMDGSD